MPSKTTKGDKPAPRKRKPTQLDRIEKMVRTMPAMAQGQRDLDNERFKVIQADLSILKSGADAKVPPPQEEQGVT